MEKGFVKDVIERMKKPKAPYTTISSIIRILENKGFVGHKAYGNTHEYFTIISKTDYRRATFKNLVNKYFDNSVKNVVSFLIKEEKLSDSEIEELYSLIKENHPKKK
jgi:predicted transcriptional regulator